MKESDLFEPVKNMFFPFDYEVYSEVKGKWFTKRADMVLTKQDVLSVIELKKSLSFKLIDQARFWLRFADYVYVAVPKTKAERSRTAIEVLKGLGIGLIEIDMNRYEIEKSKCREEILPYSRYANIVLKPVLNTVSTRDRQQFNVLSEEHKTWNIGGSRGGKYVTPYGLLMNDVYAFLREELNNTDTDGWCSVQDIFNYLQENSRDSVIKHYKNPIPSIRQAIYKYELGDIETTKIKNKPYFKIMPESTKYLNLGEIKKDA